MTPHDLVDALLLMNEEEGWRLLQTWLPALDTDSIALLVDLLKREAAHQWIKDVHLSFILSGHLIAIGNMMGNKYYHAIGLWARGDALRRMHNDRDALPFLDVAGEEFLGVGDELSWARTRIGRVSACLQLNRTTEALKDTATAREVFMRHSKWTRAGQIDVNAGVINYELGQYDEALRQFDRAIETYLLQGEGVDLHIARARGNKAITLAAQGKFREAVALHEQARATFAAYGGQEVSVAREDLNIAQIYASQGHYSRALLLFDQSRTIFEQHSMHFEAAEVAQHICYCLIRLNRAHEAYELAGQIAAFFRKSLPHRHNLAQSLMYQAEAAMLEGNLQDADKMLLEARDILVEDNFIALASIVQLQQAELYFASGRLDASLREAQHVADAFAEQQALPQLARTALLQARIAAALGDATTSRYLCDQALDIARGQGILDLKYRCDYLLGQIAEQRGDLDAAAHYYDQAVQGIDEVQSRLVLDERTSFLEDKGGVYQHAMILALKRGNRDQALIYVEKAKSRVLGDYLRNNIDIRLRAADKEGEAVLEDLARLREEQAWYSSIVYEAENEANLSDTAILRRRAIAPEHARREMQQRERRIEQLLEQMQLRMAGDLVAGSHHQWTNSIVTSLWPRLERSVVILEYYIAEQDLYIFQLTRNGIDVHLVPGAVPKLERLLLDAPNFSHIRLSDQQLSTIEAFNLDLSSCSLVTLSACETGRAVVGGVDEVIGLGRGFLYAGAASLLPTLWKVDDASSAELMETFYQALLGEFSKVAALASAQRAFLARARTSVRPYRVHPYFWAAFHLIGDPGPL